MCQPLLPTDSPIAAGQQSVKIKPEPLAGLQIHDGAASYPHNHPLECRSVQYDHAWPHIRAPPSKENRMTSQSQRPPMDPVVVDTLLEALSNDDDFRALFVRDPRAALAKAGHVADDQDALRCLQVTTLASKQELAEARKALRSRL
ncbi:MAG: putative modified peptide, partial [Ottowia sp.]